MTDIINIAPGHLFSLQGCISTRSPGHGSPAKKGPKHTLCLCWFPPPQVLVQLDQELHCCHCPSTGHSLRKQSRICSHSPWHSEPPYDGPLHSRVRCIVPFEHETEQELQLDHSFQTPSTGRKKTELGTTPRERKEEREKEEASVFCCQAFSPF